MKDVRIALIGYGRFGSLHADGITAVPGAQLAGIATRSENTAAAAAKRFPGVKITTDYRELITSPDIDAVDIVVPTYLHYEVARAALEAGKHVMLEKPMTPHVDECRKLADMAKTKNKVLAIGFKRRGGEMWKKVKSLVESGVVGIPQFALFELWRCPYRLGSEGWRYDIDRVGSWVLEEPVHCFDLARWLLRPTAGDVVSVYARANSRQPDHPELHDNFSAMLEFENGAHATICQTLSAWGHHHSLKITGIDGALWSTWRGARDDAPPEQIIEHLHSPDRSGEPERIEFAPTTETHEIEHEVTTLVGAIRNGTPVAADAEDGVWSIAVCDAVRRSLETHVPVPLAESLQ